MFKIFRLPEMFNEFSTRIMKRFDKLEKRFENVENVSFVAKGLLEELRHNNAELEYIHILLKREKKENDILRRQFNSLIENLKVLPWEIFDVNAISGIKTNKKGE